MTEGICLRPGISYRGMDEANMPARQRCSGGSCPDFADSNYDGEGLVSSRSGYDPNAFGKLVQIDEQAVPQGIWKRPNRAKPNPPEQDSFAWLPIASSPLLLLGPKGIAAYLLINGASACGVEFRDEAPRSDVICGGEVCSFDYAFSACIDDRCEIVGCLEGWENANGIKEDGCECRLGVVTDEICDNKDNDCDGVIDEEVARACYTGPANTRGVGECRDGIETCSAGEWGDCVGDQLPTPEACDGLDNNCDRTTDNSAAPSCRPPVLTSIGNKEVNEEQELSFTISAVDPDDEDTLIYSASNLPRGAGFNTSTRTFTWTPTYLQSAVYPDIHFEVTDRTSIDSEDITITVNNVNRAPVMEPIADQIVNENQLLTVAPIASDPDGEALTFSGENLPAGSSVDRSTGIFTWRPGFEQAGTYPNVGITAGDGEFSVTQGFDITVNHVNRPPIVDTIGAKEVNENELLEFTISASDPDGDNLIYFATNLPAGASFNPLNKTFTWTPNYRQSGVYPNIHFEVTDGSLIDSEDITVTVGNTEIPFTEVGESLGVNDSGHGKGVAWGDYDNDGDLDLYVANDGQNLLYRNDGVTFTKLGAGTGVNSSGSGQGVAWGDYDNDGDLDLYVANSRGEPNLLYRNNGGNFTEVGEGLGVNDSADGYGVAWGDYDNDGSLDLYVASHGWNNLLYRNDGSAFTEIGSNLWLYFHSGYGVAWGDYDNDGDLDLYVACHFYPNLLYRNNGGTFTEDGENLGVNDSGNGYGVAWGDYDNDGYLDLYVTNELSLNKLYQNLEGFGFTETGERLGAIPLEGTGGGAAWGDYDNDGDLDLYLTNAFARGNRLYRNDGWCFTEVGWSLGVMNSWQGEGVAWGDYDNDGDMDLYVANYNAPNLLYRNETGHLNNYLIIKTIGTTSNRDGIGARVKVEATIPEQNPDQPTTQIREVSGGSGYLSQDSLPVEFGLGSALMADRVTIRWPSGIEQTLLNCSPNQLIEVTEAEETRDCE